MHITDVDFTENSVREQEITVCDRKVYSLLMHGTNPAVRAELTISQSAAKKEKQKIAITAGWQ